MFIRGPGSSSHQRGRRFVVDSKYFLGALRLVLHCTTATHFTITTTTFFVTSRARSTSGGSFFTCCQSKGGLVHRGPKKRKYNCTITKTHPHLCFQLRSFFFENRLVIYKSRRLCIEIPAASAEVCIFKHGIREGCLFFFGKESFGTF